MTPKEVLEALLAGKKLRSPNWAVVKYIHLVGETLENDSGIPFGELYLKDAFELYVEKPKDCPFCGSAVTTGDDSTYWCFCSNINCSLIGPKRPTKELTIEAWNKIKVEK
jgi:hypothetical protein